MVVQATALLPQERVSRNLDGMGKCGEGGDQDGKAKAFMPFAPRLFTGSAAGAGGRCQKLLVDLGRDTVLGPTVLTRWPSRIWGRSPAQGLVANPLGRKNFQPMFIAVSGFQVPAQVRGNRTGPF